jgi:inosose dehydratase
LVHVGYSDEKTFVEKFESGVSLPLSRLVMQATLGASRSCRNTRLRFENSRLILDDSPSFCWIKPTYQSVIQLNFAVPPCEPKAAVLLDAQFIELATHVTLMLRRTFVASLACALPSAWARGTVSSQAPVKLGCQTNAWRVDPANFDSLLSVLTKLKEMGYGGFETGYRNIEGQFANAVGARKLIEQSGLTFFGTHIFLEKYDTLTNIAPLSLIQRVAFGAAPLGAQRLIVSGAPVVKDGKLNQDALMRKAEGLNVAARYCKTKGLRLAYHNHGPELAHDGLEIEALIQNTDATLVDFLVDCGWAFHAGANVPAFFAKHHRRLIGLHVRDFKDGKQVILGEGGFPLAALAAEIQKANWTGWVLNEEERLSGEKLGETAVAPAREAIRKAFGK